MQSPTLLLANQGSATSPWRFMNIVTRDGPLCVFEVETTLSVEEKKKCDVISCDQVRIIETVRHVLASAKQYHVTLSRIFYREKSQ